VQTECPNCRVEYRRTTTWGAIGNQFFSREKTNALKKSLNQEQIRKAVLDEINTREKVVYDREKGKKIKIKEKIDVTVNQFTAETAKEFHARVKQKMVEKEIRLRLLEEENLAATCTFQPILKKKVKQYGECSQLLLQ
jgi:uncharacterized protein (DUF2344 family)